MALALYHSPYSTCSQKVRLVLAEKSLDYESRLIDFAAQDQLAPEYLKLNPHGVVPTLVHDGEAITDSSCIMEYLDEVFPDPPMTGGTPLERARVRALLRYIEEVPTVAIRYPSFQNVFLPILSLLSTPEQFDDAASKRTLRAGFYRKMNSGAGFDAAEVAESESQLQQTIDKAEGVLQGQPWLTGERFGIADCGLVPTVDRMDDLGMASAWADRPAFRDWLERVHARPSFVAAFFAGSRLSERPEFESTVAAARAARG